MQTAEQEVHVCVFVNGGLISAGKPAEFSGLSRASGKMHSDGADLAVCCSSHIRPPYACARGDDIVHVSLFQVAAGIFPDEAGNDVQGEQLAVVGMTAEIKVCT